MAVPSVAELAKKTYLSPAKRQIIADEVGRTRSILSDPSVFDGAASSPNLAQLQEQLVASEKMLADGTPPPVSQADKNHLYKKMSELESEFIPDMLSTDQLRSGSAADVDWCLSFDARHKQRVLAWRNIRKTLDPENDNPNFTSIEQFRTSKPPLGDPRKYFQGFDNIQFEQVLEEELRELDEDSFLRFAGMQAMGWSRKTICTEMSWDSHQYEVAMAKWREYQGAMNQLEDEPPAAALEPEVLAPESQEVFDPAAEMENRGITLTQLANGSGIGRLKLSNLLRGRKGYAWKQDEIDKVTSFFSEWDTAKAAAT